VVGFVDPLRIAILQLDKGPRCLDGGMLRIDTAKLHHSATPSTAGILP